MFVRALFHFCVLLLVQEVFCFVDECRSLAPEGLKTLTRNLTVDRSVVSPQTDLFRYSRNAAEDGFARYVSTRGFESLLLTGYVYYRTDNDAQWELLLQTGAEVEEMIGESLRIDRRNVQDYEEPWPETFQGESNWHKFVVNLTLDHCPKVVEVWLRGYASANMLPGWALQIGTVELQESLYEDCSIPDCFLQSEEDCSTDFQRTRSVTTDTGGDFSKVYLVSENLITESANAISSFNGDSTRIRRNSSRKGIITYSIAEGITSIEVTLYRCVTANSSLTLTPYFHPQCKPIHHEPELLDDSYNSNCWRRFKTRVNFEEFMDCPPQYVDLVIRGRHPRALQISQVVLTGFGPTVQNAEFRQALTGADSLESLNEAEETGDSSDTLSMKYWLPVLVTGVVLLLLIAAVLIISRSDTAKNYMKDYIGDKYPSLYNYLYGTAPPQDSAIPKSVVSRRMRSNSRLFRSQSMSRGSLTFGKSLKRMREAPSRGTAITRDGFGEQLIDLSKHLHRSFWSSKVGGKGQKIEIEERLGKGGFGKVWKARWQGTLVALKVVPLHASLTGEEKATRMAIMEAALTGCLAHPNIVSTYTCEIRETNNFDAEMQNLEAPGDVDKKWMSFERFAHTNASKSFLKSKTKTDLEVRMIMEFCDRGSLVEGIRKGWLKQNDHPDERDFEAILLTALDIARGLGCLHQNNIIHGDLKPHNVLLQNKPFVDTRGFIAKIADFGLSIQIEQEQSHVDGMRMGTGGYVSPEVALRGKILPASDIYSFGILLWELFTGELIQDALKDAPKVSSRLTMGSWRPIFQDDCPRPYWRLASMCWNDFPDWRPTLEYIIDELNEMLKALHNAEKAKRPPETEQEEDAS